MRAMAVAEPFHLDHAGIGRVLKSLAQHLDHHGGWMPPWLSDALGIIRLEGDLADPQRLRIDELRDLPALTQTVTYTSSAGQVSNTFTGALLTDVLDAAGGVVTDPDVHNDILAHDVVATGSDGYRAVFSMGEILPRFGNEPIMVAYHDTAGQLGWCGEDGRARMVVPGDAAGGRYVSNLVGIEVVDIDTDPVTPDCLWA